MLGIVIASVATTYAWSADELPAPDKTGGVDLGNPEVIQRGLKLLNTACGGYCHGTDGRGLKAPSLRNRTDLAWNSLHATITNGRKRAGKMMPAWKGSIPDDDIWAAVAAIISLRSVEASVEPENKH